MEPIGFLIGWWIDLHFLSFIISNKLLTWSLSWRKTPLMDATVPTLMLSTLKIFIYRRLWSSRALSEWVHFPISVLLRPSRPAMSFISINLLFFTVWTDAPSPRSSPIALLKPSVYVRMYVCKIMSWNIDLLEFEHLRVRFCNVIDRL